MSEGEPPYIELWLWEYTDLSGRRQRTTYLLTEEDARQRFGSSAKRVPGSLERRPPRGNSGDRQKPE